ncbi:MAG: acetyl-CoA carboxylase biotin carboxyl carrier protein subunit [Bacteroidia bacterium]|nr:acetyl-CoA carboxylase biotin carboxyl carrier protein subunit [Bacteroidia bacterium]
MEENNSKYQVFVVNSVRYLTLTTTKFDKRKKWQKADPKEIRSIIPGSVIEIFVSPGQELKEGEVLLTLDAMKMYTKVEMPFDGVIKSINVIKGDRIPKDTVMITIE